MGEGILRRVRFVIKTRHINCSVNFPNEVPFGNYTRETSKNRRTIRHAPSTKSSFGTINEIAVEFGLLNQLTGVEEFKRQFRNFLFNGTNLLHRNNQSTNEVVVSALWAIVLYLVKICDIHGQIGVFKAIRRPATLRLPCTKLRSNFRLNRGRHFNIVLGKKMENSI